MREECDINKIVAKARKGQMVSHVASRPMTYGDFSDVGDYKTALDRLRAADEYFGHLPAVVRQAFQNDPAAFLDASETPEGVLKLQELGLLPKEKPAEPVVPAPPAPPA